jgi:hypothetical protein
MSHEILKRELVRTIMGNFGAIPERDFGSQGIAKKEFLTSKTLDIQYEQNLQSIKYNVYAAQMVVDGGAFRVISASLNDDLVVVFRFDGVPTLYGLRLDYYGTIDGQDWGGLFCTKVSDTKWMSASLFDRLMVCAGIEKLVNLEYFWTKCDNYEDLFSAMVELVEM